ncbi:MAG: hypothetical protein LBH19_01250 [Dysgonamonadaceae bacterium]|nr:hypothetical protein [Dysgonamonadaceae bacterium]
MSFLPSDTFLMECDSHRYAVHSWSGMLQTVGYAQSCGLVHPRLPRYIRYADGRYRSCATQPQNGNLDNMRAEDKNAVSVPCVFHPCVWRDPENLD